MSLLPQDNDRGGNSSGTFQLVLIATIVMTVFMLFSLQKKTDTPPPSGNDTTAIDLKSPEIGTPQDNSSSLAADTTAALTADTTAALAAAPAAPKAETPREPAPTGVQALLPPPCETNSDADLVTLSNDSLELTFTRIGARLKSATEKLGNQPKNWVQMVPKWGDTPDAKAIYPFGLRFSEDFLDNALDSRRWDARVNEANGEVSFSIEVPGLCQVEKTFRLDSSSPCAMDVAVAYTNLEPAMRVLGLDTQEPAFSLKWGPNVNSEDANSYMPQELVWRVNGSNHSQYTKKIELPLFDGRTSMREQNAEWMAIRSAYFAVAMKPEFPGADAWVWGNGKHFWMGIGAPRIEVAPNTTETRAFRTYLGPRMEKPLEEAWSGLDSLMDVFTVWGFTPLAWFMNMFSRFMLHVMNWCYTHVYAGYGIAVIILTFIVRLGMLPLTWHSMKHMKRMQKLAPAMELIKEEVGDDQQELQRRMMELYKQHGTNPMSGCFPLLLQMPVFIAFYRMLSNAFELRGAGFWWIDDLSKQDALIHFPFSIPIPFMSTGLDSLNILPLLMAVAMLASQEFMPASATVQNSQQKFMMRFMPVFFSVICYNMAAALNLYILTSTLIGIIQSQLMKLGKDDDPVPIPESAPKAVSSKTPAPPAPKAAPKQKHFYNALLERKREMAREERREKEARRRRGGQDFGNGRNNNRNDRRSGKR